MFRRFYFSRIWSSAQDHAVLVLLLNLVGVFISTWQNLSGANDLYWRCTSFEKAFRRGRPLNILHDSVGRVGCLCVIHHTHETDSYGIHIRWHLTATHCNILQHVTPIRWHDWCLCVIHLKYLCDTSVWYIVTACDICVTQMYHTEVVLIHWSSLDRCITLK